VYFPGGVNHAAGVSANPITASIFEV